MSLVAFRVFTSFDMFRRDVASADAYDWLFDVREHPYESIECHQTHRSPR